MSIILTFHIFAGSVALLAGAAALCFSKGSSAHAKAGKWFVLSMLIMCGLGAFYAYLTPHTITVLAGCFTAYMVASAWLVIKRQPLSLGQADTVLIWVPVAVCVSAVLHGLEAAASPQGFIEGLAVGPDKYFLFAGLAGFALLGDVRMLWHGGCTRQERLTRHIWRMCFAMHMATTSFFEGQAKLFPVVIQESGLLSLPGHIVLLVMLYFLIKPWIRRLSGIKIGVPDHSIKA